MLPPNEMEARKLLGFDPKRIVAWMTKPGTPMKAIDNPAFARMADDVIASMTAVGGADHVAEMYLALLKAMSLLLVTQTMEETPEFIAKICGDFAHMLYDDVLLGRDAALKDANRGRAKHG